MMGRGHAVVIGASGLVGSALVRQLLDDGWEVTATVRDAGAAALVGAALQGARVAMLVDALDGESVRAILADSHPNVVVNCVSTNPTSGNEAARAYGNGNATAVAVTLDACARADVGRAIVFGSGFEYAPASYPLDENSTDRAHDAVRSHEGRRVHDRALLPCRRTYGRMRGPPVQPLRSTRASASICAVRHHLSAHGAADRDVGRHAAARLPVRRGPG